MASYRFHAGRLVVFSCGDLWFATIKIKQDIFEVKLDATKAEAAILEGEQEYAEAKGVTNSKPYCWQCIHWEPVKSECGLGFPEGRRSGGRFASKCSCFWGD